MYAVHDSANTDTYVMQGTELNSHLPSPVLENTSTMATDGMSEYVVDPSLYYPTATGYGYYCTGYESTGEWIDHQALFGVEGADVHYAGAQTENFPYVYYTPGYGYGESAFNPYNPYIPGAMIGVDGSCVGTQPYYVSPYPDSVSAAGYYPVLVQADPNVVANASMDTISDVGPSTTHRANALGAKRTQSSASASVPVNRPKSASSQANSVKGASQSSKNNIVTAKRPMSSRNSGSGGSVHGVSSHMMQSGNAPSLHQSGGKLSAEANQMNYSYPLCANVSDYTSITNGQATAGDTWSKLYHREAFNDYKGNVDPLSEQNRGPRTNKSKNQIVVKAYTTKAGDFDSEGNIVISADNYNKDEFPLDYANARYFVIKSYSEDDVHKSIKYNVWSSTPNGNKKLNSAYEAQKASAGKSGGFPVFLFFSVNASGQFCGVAEMIGPVDFNKDMDFWQQDKWSGSFPVKWHFIKDVPNPTFRHIILENNEHKPVTNSRDTQEILHKPGREMLKVFKNYLSKTSVLDDFMYYENRQRMMFEERARHLRRGNGHAHIYAPQQPLKLNTVVDRPVREDGPGAWVEKGVQPNGRSGLEKTTGSPTEKVSSSVSVENSGTTSTVQNPLDVDSGDAVSTLKIGLLSIHPKQLVEQNVAKSASSTSAASVPTVSSAASVPTVSSAASVPTVSSGAAVPTKPAAANVTARSMPTKANGSIGTPETINIGSIELDPAALEQVKNGGLAKGGPSK